MKDINYALVETKRPPMYKGVKYWGKKPHNIWAKYIENYVPPNGIYLDPFSGSGIGVFEAVISGRRAISLDLNPLTSFFIEVYNSKWNDKIFENKIKCIVKNIKENELYKKYFYIECDDCNQMSEIICYRENNDTKKLYGIGYTCDCLGDQSKKRNKKKKNILNEIESKYYENVSELMNMNFIPQDLFPVNDSLNSSFLMKLNSKSVKDLWNDKNLLIISLIFQEIFKETDKDLKKQLMFTFIQMLHLSSRMCVPRDSDGADRWFSTSWGRSAFILSGKSFIANPLIWFERSALDKQSTKKVMNDYKERLKGREIIIKEINTHNYKNAFKGKWDILYGCLDAEAMNDFIPDNSVDFVLTDPPYGGLVQYMSLSLIWNVWLKLFDELKYNYDLKHELTIDKNNNKNKEWFNNKMVNVLIKIKKKLKNDSKCVITFHNKNIEIFNGLIESIRKSGFIQEKIIYQQNLRTGESNVANPHGTSASDFYFRLSKTPNEEVKDFQVDKYENLIVEKAINILSLRAEPTNFDILYSGIISEISKKGYDSVTYSSDPESVLRKKRDIFLYFENDKMNNGGNIWWFKNPEKYIFNSTPLNERVRISIINLLRSNGPTSLDEILAEIFIKFPNGLTPNKINIRNEINKVADINQNKFVLKPSFINDLPNNETKHSEIIFKILQFGNKLAFETAVGKRERSEIFKGKKLSTICTYKGAFTEKNRNDNFDALWFESSEKKPTFVFEVENSTEFNKSVNRSSHLEGIKKIMIIPEYREEELKRTANVSLKREFKLNLWKYVTYSQLELVIKRFSSKKITNREKLHDLIWNEGKDL